MANARCNTTSTVCFLYPSMSRGRFFTSGDKSLINIGSRANSPAWDIQYKVANVTPAVLFETYQVPKGEKRPSAKANSQNQPYERIKKKMNAFFKLTPFLINAFFFFLRAP